MAAAAKPRASRHIGDMINQHLVGDEDYDGQRYLAVVFPNHEVPFETIKCRKSFSVQDSYKIDMRLKSIRQGGQVGIKDGSYGVITYGDYSEKDLHLMKSIGDKDCSAVVIPDNESYEVPMEIGSTKEKPSIKFKNHHSYKTDIEKDKSAGDQMKKCACYELKDLCEIPSFEVMEKSSTHKNKMAKSMLRQSGVCGSPYDGGLGFLVYGSFGAGEDVAF